MEEKRTRGGKRNGAGRKPIDNPKKQFTFYFKKEVAYKFGGEEKMKEKVNQFVEKYGEEQPKVYDAPKRTYPTHDEPNQCQEPKDYNYYYNQIKNLEGQEECTDFIYSVKADQNLAGWQKKMLEDRLRAKWQ